MAEPQIERTVRRCRPNRYGAYNVGAGFAVNGCVLCSAALWHSSDGVEFHEIYPHPRCLTADKATLLARALLMAVEWIAEETEVKA